MLLGSENLCPVSYCGDTKITFSSMSTWFEGHSNNNCNCNLMLKPEVVISLLSV